MADENKRVLHECWDALVKLGNAFQDGEGVEYDFEEAVHLYQLAAEHGHAEGQFKLGECYENGLGVKKNLTEAAKWYRKAAVQCHADAQFYLGFCYLKGWGVKQDLREATQWCRKAAMQGCDDAQYVLGSCYEYGAGVEENVVEAIKWYRQVAEHGYGPAQFKLGKCYEEGKGVSKNMIEALKWYRKAAEQGDLDAKKRLEQLNNQLRNGQSQNGEHEKSEVGKACWDGTIGELLALDRGEFKKIMKENFSRFVRKPMNPSEIASWMDTFDVLKKDVFKAFSYYDLINWKKLRIAFEMVLPNQRRTDVLIFTSTMILVLEFKRHEEPWEKRINEVKAYRKKIEKWPDVRKGRKVRGIVVYTRCENYEYQRALTHMCTSDLLAEKLLHLQPNPRPMR